MRVLIEEDLEQVLLLDKVLFPGEQWMINEFEQFLAKGFGLVEDAGLIHGYVMVRPDAQLSEVMRIGVIPAHRRTGLASRLLTAALKQIVSDGVVLTVRKSNSAAIQLYLKHDFKLVGMRRRYYRDGEDSLVLQRRLTL